MFPLFLCVGQRQSGRRVSNGNQMLSIVLSGMHLVFVSNFRAIIFKWRSSVSIVALSFTHIPEGRGAYHKKRQLSGNDEFFVPPPSWGYDRCV